VDSARTQLLRQLLSSTGWVERTRDFARQLRRSTDAHEGLLLVGTPTEEPWHLAAHLDDEARLGGLPQLSPTLVRWAPPPKAPPHLSFGLERIEQTRRGETLFVVAPDSLPEQLLERVSDARDIGATILSIDGGDDDLASLAHERLYVPPDADVALVVTAEMPPPVDMDTVQHLVSLAAGEQPQRPALRDRLAQLLERLSGPAPER
jgi:hypothetical protein